MPCYKTKGDDQCDGFYLWSSGAAGEFLGFGRDFDFFALFDEEGDFDFDAGFEFGGLGDGSAGGVAADAGLGVGDLERDLGGQLDADGVAVEFMDLEQRSFEEEVEGVAD